MRNRQTDTTLTDRIKFAGYSVVGKYLNSAALREVIYCGVNRGGGGPPTSVDARPATLATPPRARERKRPAALGGHEQI